MHLPCTLYVKYFLFVFSPAIFLIAFQDLEQSLQPT